MKKVFALILALLMGLPAAAMADTIVMGSSIDWPPYEYYDDDTGEIVGIEVDLVRAIAEKLGYDLEIQDMQFDSIIMAVVSGKVDLGVSGFTVTEERKQSVDFTVSYTTVQQSVIVPVGSGITSVEDLLDPEKGYRIGVQLGTTGDLYISDDVESNGLKHTIERFNKAPDAIIALDSGKVDCVIMDDSVARSFLSAYENLTMLDTAYTLEDYAICFAKGSPLYEPFNAALQEMMADGSVQAIIDRYITAD